MNIIILWIMQVICGVGLIFSRIKGVESDTDLFSLELLICFCTICVIEEIRKDKK